ncbi:60S ribosomal protein L19-2 [Arabidopsis lyrata subsp. lyrata]|uniref:60S ribosomal protein L19-2 n=1 Tax=Arabidopsis lyrata subsp. lyrata TaxID=81972 RepID=UPI000A29C540|nr:60S ribosomal protein L19-2 [Arabidopsis lyrata subsp. lyrata]|eukprot:XP_020874974.1 60S ribosomal protein L19-2 [Arabidopsis lyrata subsp. lyrata]
MVSINFHSRFRSRRKCRRTGYGKVMMETLRRKMKLLMRRLKMLKRLLKKFCWNKNIDKHVYQDMLMKVKGNVYKTKSVLMKSIHKSSRERKFARSEKRLTQVPEGEKAAPAPQQEE